MATSKLGEEMAARAEPNVGSSDTIGFNLAHEKVGKTEWPRS
jgi:hypothetical protein